MNPAGLWEVSIGRIIVHRRELRSFETFAGTLLHELTHAHTSLDDVSRDFEEALTRLIGRLAATAAALPPNPIGALNPHFVTEPPIAGSN